MLKNDYSKIIETTMKR